MNKWLRICLLASLCVCVSGCGKESNSISENLINENPTQLTGDIVDRYVSENNTENIFGSVTNEVSSDNLSDNTISDNLVSGNEVSANEGIMISGNQAETNPFSGAGVSMNYVFTDEISNCLNIVNLSGKDIDSLYITFNAGSINNMEILGTESFHDGTSFTYAITDMDSLKEAKDLKLTISATAKDDTSLIFGTADILNPGQMTVVLTWDESGYKMYID